MYSFSTLFTEANSSRVILESIKALKINSSMIFKLVFASNTILCFVSFFLIIGLYFLIPTIIREIFIVTAELAIPTEIPTKEARAEIETNPVSVEARISKCSK